MMSEESLPIAFSPCPNDTFIFYAWIHGMISAPSMEAHLLELEELNKNLLAGHFPISKGSIAILPKILDEYIMLPVGAALGWNCGPKLISKKPILLEKLSSLTVALPGIHTTAHMLLDKLCIPPRQKIFCPYNEIVDKICSGEVDAGVIIHETRFSFQKYGLYEVTDFGTVWHEQTQLPLPLGAYYAKRSLGNEVLNTLCEAIQLSILAGKKHINEAMPFLARYSQEKDLKIIRKHMELYVTEESLHLSQKGVFAIEFLLGLDKEQNWLHSMDNKCVSSSLLH